MINPPSPTLKRGGGGKFTQSNLTCPKVFKKSKNSLTPYFKFISKIRKGGVMSVKQGTLCESSDKAINGEVKM